MLKAPPRSNTRVMNVAFNMPGTSRGMLEVPVDSCAWPSASSFSSNTLSGAPVKLRAGSSNTKSALRVKRVGDGRQPHLDRWRADSPPWRLTAIARRASLQAASWR